MGLEQMLSSLGQSREVLSFCLISPWPLLTLPESTMEAGLGGAGRDPMGRHRMASVLRVHTSKIKSASWAGELQQPCKISAACRVRRQQPGLPALAFFLYRKVFPEKLYLDSPSKGVRPQQPLPGISSYYLRVSGNPALGSHCKLSTRTGRNWGHSPPAQRGRRDTLPPPW